MISILFCYNCSLLVSKGKLNVQVEVGIRRNEKVVTTTAEKDTEICFPHEMIPM
jgi:hypothetical protein